MYTKNPIKPAYLFGTIFRQVTPGLGIIQGTAMALLGGCWYPLEMFPQVVQKVVKILPTSWAMQGLLDIVSRGKGLVEILPAAGVLMGFAVVFFVIGIVRFRYE